MIYNLVNNHNTTQITRPVHQDITQHNTNHPSSSPRHYTTQHKSPVQFTQKLHNTTRRHQHLHAGIGHVQKLYTCEGIIFNKLMGSEQSLLDNQLSISNTNSYHFGPWSFQLFNRSPDLHAIICCPSSVVPKLQSSSAKPLS